MSNYISSDAKKRARKNLGVPEGGDGGSNLKIYVDSAIASNGSFVTNAFYYEDGSEITCANRNTLLEAIADGQTVYVYAHDSKDYRLGVVIVARYSETSDGYRLHIGGEAMPLDDAKAHIFWHTVA